ncbi:TonB-dependent receptor plug domain-containing protein [Aureibaculum conchae]|uniref:TonB-dependent receptor plug domain-containing protein n=1 Tax=Aureibaculum sp. 2308TA14-22 TaxID=3108392 RepID=UPI003392520F
MKKIIPIKIGLTKQKLFSFLLFFSYVILCSYSQTKTINTTKEKIYLHIDKSEYYAGEDVWFKAYLVNGNTHSSEALSKVVYVELIAPNDSILARKTIKIVDSGGYGDFKLSTKLEKGAYTIRAYTNYMRNFDQAYFFRKSIFIKSLTSETSEVIVETASKPDVQFFPEGGYLVNDFLNQIGFKAIDSNGNGIDIKGTLIDNLGNRISNFESSHLGMGAFHFIPKKGLNYKAKIRYNQEELVYDLPKSTPTGVIIKVVEREDDYVINLKSSLDNELQNFTLLGTQRNGVVFNSKIESKEKQAVVKVPKSILKEGIVQFTLLNNNKPILERLAFFEIQEREAQLRITPSQKAYGLRELVELEVSLDTIIKSNLSIAVTDSSTVKPNKYDLDIKSQLLLNSELKGAIEQPGYYFYSDHPKRKEHLDILMMTQGWRQFIGNDVLDGNEQSTKYPIEQGFSFKGKVKKYSNRNKAESATVSLMIRNKGGFHMKNMLSDTNGYFEFGDYDITDSTSIVIQAQSLKPKKTTSKNVLKNLKTNYFIELDTFSSAVVINNINSKKSNSKNNSNQHFVKLKNHLVKSNAAFDKENDRIKLDEVALKADVGLKKYDTYIKNKQLYREPSQRVDFAELGNLLSGNILQNLEGRIAGFSTKYMEESGDGRTINGIVAYSTRTGGLPLHLLDGIPVDAGAIMMIPTTEVLFVDVLRGTKATIYGPEAAHGVIAIYTRDGSEDKRLKSKKRKGIINFIHPGYSQARKFYEPVYKTKKGEGLEFDYRSTIYWNPILKIYERGKVKVTFYTADFETTYRIDIQGITAEGQILKAEMFVNVE